MAAELLVQAAKEELPQLDEKLFLNTFSEGKSSVNRKADRKQG